MKKSALLELSVPSLSLLALIGLAQQASAAQASPALKTKIAVYRKLPIGLEANRGQTNSSVKFLARVKGDGLYLAGLEAVLAVHAPQPAMTRSGAELQGAAHLPPVDA